MKVTFGIYTGCRFFDILVSTGKQGVERPLHNYKKEDDDLEIYELEPYVDMSYNVECAKNFRKEILLVTVVLLRLTLSYWKSIECPLLIRSLMTHEQLIMFQNVLYIAVFVLRIVGSVICLLDIEEICMNQRGVKVVILVISWFLIRPLYFFVRGLILQDGKVIGRGAVESYLYFIALFMFIIGGLDKIASELAAIG